MKKKFDNKILIIGYGAVSRCTLPILMDTREGIKLPDDIPHDFILDIAKPYLGKFVSIPSDWTPLKNRKIFFKENPIAKGNPDI